MEKALTFLWVIGAAVSVAALICGVAELVGRAL